MYITQLLADRGRVIGHYRKRTLGEDEEAYGVGADPAGFVLEEKPIGIAICAEGGADTPFDDAAAAGAGVVFFCSAPGLYGRRTNEQEWRAGFEWWSGSALGDAARHARRLGVWVALSTQAGSSIDEDFPGPRRRWSTRTAPSSPRSPTGTKAPCSSTSPTDRAAWRAASGRLGGPELGCGG